MDQLILQVGVPLEHVRGIACVFERSQEAACRTDYALLVAQLHLLLFVELVVEACARIEVETVGRLYVRVDVGRRSAYECHVGVA